MENINSLVDHPVLRDVAKLPTPSIKLAYELIQRAILLRASGCSFVGAPRIGKSFAIDVLCSQLKEQWPNIPVIRIDAQERRFSEPQFLYELLEAVDIRGQEKFREQPRVLTTRLVNALWSKADSVLSDRLIMFVDEAQNWNHEHLSSLRNVTNALARLYGIRIIAILFGTSLLANLRTVLISTSRNDLVGRFLGKQFDFAGVTKVSELREIMSCYDDAKVSEYPIGSGKSYSQLLLPKAFDSGWRLENEAGMLWTEFRKVLSKRRGLKGIGMRWIAGTIATFFLEQQEHDKAKFSGRADDWEFAVDAADFSDS